MAAEFEFWNTFDPSIMQGQGSRDQILDVYRQVRDQLLKRIKARFGEAAPLV